MLAGRGTPDATRRIAILGYHVSAAAAIMGAPQDSMGANRTCNLLACTPSLLDCFSLSSHRLLWTCHNPT